MAASDGNTSQHRQEGSFQLHSFLCFGTFCVFVGDVNVCMSFFFSLSLFKYLVIWLHWISVAWVWDLVPLTRRIELGPPALRAQFACCDIVVLGVKMRTGRRSFIREVLDIFPSLFSPPHLSGMLRVTAIALA